MLKITLEDDGIDISGVPNVNKNSNINYLNNNLKAKQKYELNKKIIDFNYIPKNLYNKIIKKYLDIFKT